MTPHEHACRIELLRKELTCVDQALVYRAQSWKDFKSLLYLRMKIKAELKIMGSTFTGLNIDRQSATK